MITLARLRRTLRPADTSGQLFPEDIEGIARFL
jgi:hypothetical protein